MHNIELLREKYPEYYGEYVNFNAVLHQKNSVDDIYTFFKGELNKMPRIGELSGTGIRQDKLEAFFQTYRNSTESLNQSEHYTEIIKNMSLTLGSYQSVAVYLTQYSDFSYNSYNELLYGRSAQSKIPTGTCMPFSKKVFVTVNGKILPCERIGHQFALGKITETQIDLDFQTIANTYNKYYSMINGQCNSCFNRKSCVQCIFNFEEINDSTCCQGHMDKEKFKRYEKAQWEFLKENPEEYYKIMNNSFFI